MPDYHTYSVTVTVKVVVPATEAGAVTPIDTVAEGLRKAYLDVARNCFAPVRAAVGAVTLTPGNPTAVG
jgi:hypothetical protein